MPFTTYDLRLRLAQTDLEPCQMSIVLQNLEWRRLGNILVRFVKEQVCLTCNLC